MCIELTTQVLKISSKFLTPIEKHILTVLSFKANQRYEVYSTVSKLMQECGYSRNTVEKALSSLRSKHYLIYLGKSAPKSKRIPVYCINLNNPTTWGDKTLITPPHGGIIKIMTPPDGVRIDNKRLIDNRREESKLTAMKHVRDILEELKK